MSTIAENLNTLYDIKDGIKAAIEGKGVDVGEAPFAEYAQKINDIEVGGDCEEVYQDGYNSGYGVGYEQGMYEASEVIGGGARVLNITQNGRYFSKYSDVAVSDQIVGYFNDGTEFGDYATLTNMVYNTFIEANKNDKITIWYKSNGSQTTMADIFGTHKDSPQNAAFKLHYSVGTNYITVDLGESYVQIGEVDTDWHCYEFSLADGVYVDGVYMGAFADNSNLTGYYFINSTPYYIHRCANGTFGMIKINDIILIPTEDGFINYTTNEPLKVFKEGEYDFVEAEVVEPSGELIKTVNVNVQPVLSVAKNKIKLAYSGFQEAPPILNFDGITDTTTMFAYCGNLLTAPYFDTSEVTRMESMFQNTSSLKSVPLYDTSNVTTMYSMFNNSAIPEIPPFDMSKVTTVERMCYGCKIKTFPSVNTENVTNMSRWFYNCTDLESLPQFNAQNATTITYLFYGNMAKLTEFGGFLNLKANINDNYGFVKCSNLSYESCINILNGLYDFVGNGETPTSSQGKLKVHQNFLSVVGDEISVGTNKGWTITA